MSHIRTRPVQRTVWTALLAVSLACTQLLAAPRSFIWKATGPRGGVVFLVGSVHLLTKDYYPLNPVFEASFEKADLLVEEVDMGEMLSPGSQALVAIRGLLPATESLDKVLSPATYAAARKTLAGSGIPIDALKRLKPWSLALTLQALEWQKAGFDADLGLDKHFYDLAKAKGKEVEGLETLEFQVSRFDGMPMELQDRLLLSTLKELETTVPSFTRLANAWRDGDVPVVENAVLEDLKSEPQMYERLLVERNRTWLPRIERLFSRAKSAFVVVGAAHLVGTDGLLQMLKSRGYTIEQL